MPCSIVWSTSGTASVLVTASAIAERLAHGFARLLRLAPAASADTKRESEAFAAERRLAKCFGASRS